MNYKLEKVFIIGEVQRMRRDTPRFATERVYLCGQFMIV